MNNFNPQQVAVAVDMSPLSKIALETAAHLSGKYQAQLRLVMAYTTDAPLEFTSDQVETLARQEERNLAALERELRQWAGKAVPTAAKTVIAAGRAVPTILAAAAGCDLLVVGSHGKSGFSLARLGSVSEGVIRAATMPVLSVHAAPGAVVRLQHILCPVNLTPLAQTALAAAFSLASHLGARLTVMATEEGQEQLTEQVHALCNHIGAAHGAQCSFNVVIRQGQAAEEITAVAQEQQADLIVLGAQRKTSLAEAVFGSTTEKLLRHAQTSLLVIPATGK
jgi:nucleotide-binding universal stress UspA family protein